MHTDCGPGGVRATRAAGCGPGEGAADSVDDGVLAHEKQRGGTWRHLITHALDEVVADADVRHRADQGTGRGSDRRAEQRDEEDQTQQEPPERTAECTCSGRAMQLARLRFFFSDGQLTTAPSNTSMSACFCSPSRVSSAFSAPSGSANFHTVRVAIRLLTQHEVGLR